MSRLKDILLNLIIDCRLSKITEKKSVWNYEEATLLNGFDNHDFPDKGISKLCLVNEIDNFMLLVASCEGSVMIWKNYATKGKQKLVTGFLQSRVTSPVHVT